jgi:hypothetical protein
LGNPQEAALGGKHHCLVTNPFLSALLHTLIDNFDFQNCNPVSSMADVNGKKPATEEDVSHHFDV